MSSDFRALGKIAVLIDGVERRLRPMERVLLAILVAEHNRVMSAERLADLLWRGQPPPSSRIALRVHVDRLRQAIQAGEVSRLVFATGGYRIIVEPDELDILRFESSISRGRALTEKNPAAAADLFRAALAEWSGTPFDMVDDIPAVDEARAALQRRHADLLVSLAGAELAAGRHATLVADLSRWCVADPYSEPLASALVSALYRSGDQVAALEACRTFRQRLRAGLGLDPSADFERMHQDVLQRSLVIPAQDPVPIDDARPDGLIGRGREVARALELLHRPVHNGVVAITGARGAGTSAVLLDVHERLPRSVLVRCDPKRALAAVTELEAALGIGEAMSGSSEHHDIDAEARAQWVCHHLADARTSAIMIDDIYEMHPDEADVFRRIMAWKPADTAIVTAGRGLAVHEHPLLESKDALSAVRVVEVAALRDDAARAVVASIVRADQSEDADLVESIVTTANGDAYVLSGLARHVLGGGALRTAPATISEFVNRAIGELDAGERQILGCASVIGSDRLDLGLIAAVSGESRDAVIEAAEAALALGILHDTARGVEFRHRYFREGLVAGLRPLRRAELSYRVAELLIESGCDDSARVAAHLRAGAPSADAALAVIWTIREARELVAAGAPAAGAERAALARSLAEDARLPARVGVEATLVESEARAALGDISRSEELAINAAARSREIGLTLEFAAAATLAAGPMLPAGAEREKAAALTSEAVERTDADGSTTRVALLEAWVRSHVLGSEPPDSQTMRISRELELAGDHVEPDDIRCLAFRARYNLSWRFGSGPAERLPLSVGLATCAARAGRRMLRLEGLRMQVCDHLEAGNENGVAGALENYRRQAVDLGSPLHQWWSAVLSATVSGICGDEAAERDWLAAAEEHSSWVDSDLAFGATLEREFSAAVRRNDYASLVAAIPSTDLGGLAADPLVTLASVVVAHRLGERSDVRTLHRLWLTHAHGPYAVAASVLAVLALPHCATDADTGDLAGMLVPVLRRAQGGLSFLNGAGCLGPVDIYLGRLHGELGDTLAAQQCLDRAQALTDSFATGWTGWLIDWEALV